MRRDPLGLLVVLALVACLATVVWATRNPDAELLRDAQEWPVVGSLVERFRSTYLPPEKVASDLGEPQVPGERHTVSVTRVVGPGRAVWVRSGTRLHARADAESEQTGVVEEVARLPVIEEAADWYRVLSGDQVGWVRLPEYGIEGVPPLGSDPLPPKPLPGREADEELLSEAIALLSGEAVSGRLGPYDLYTDLGDDDLLRLLAGIATGLEQVYSERYGVIPGDQARASIVLFAREGDYRRFQGRLERLAGLPAVGLVSSGVVAIYVGARGHAEVAATVVHELVHLLNRRALGPALPPWLDEGMADDLSFSAVDAAGRLMPEQLSGSAVDLGSVVIWKGGAAAALELRRALVADRALPLVELLGLDWESFVDPGQRLHYPQSALFVRFLIEGDPSLRAGFAGYLQGIAAGESVSAQALIESLSWSWQALEAGFRSWALDGLTVPSTEAGPTVSGRTG